MQRNASLFFAEIPDDIGQLAANPDLGQMLVHEESLAFGIANDDTRHVECIFSTISVTYLNGCSTPSNAAAGLRPPRKGTDVDAALEQDIQPMLQVFFGKIS